MIRVVGLLVYTEMKKKKKKGIKIGLSLMIMKGFRTALMKTGRYRCQILRHGNNDGIAEMAIHHPRYTNPCMMMIYDGAVIILARRLELADPSVEENVLQLVKECFGKRSLN